MAFAAPVWLAVQGEFVGCGEAPAPPGAPPGAPPAPPGAPPAPPGVPPAPPGAPPAPPGVPPAPPGAPPAPPGAPPAPPGAPPAPPGAPPAPPGAPPALPGAPPALPGAPPAPPGVPPAPPGALPAPPGAPPRTLLDAMDDQSVLEAFHLSRPCVSFVLDLLQRQLNRSRPPGCTAEGMTLLALGYYAKGTECTRLLETTNICDGSTAVVRVSKCLAHLSSRIIVFPKCRRDQERLAEANRRFCGIPQVLGVLGAAHFRTRGRGHGEDLSPLFCNTRGYSSVASQVVCDLAGNLLSVDRCQPGSTPNYRLWAESGLKMRKVIRPEYWLIGREEGDESEWGGATGRASTSSRRWPRPPACDRRASTWPTAMPGPSCPPRWPA
ncbi:hypothetical protein NHX12_025059 [Muraenolepis orangiensis]|uniref:DDE Tnp4 domain-containing protein n=1 Tax=Muraenolepis orangiensis TaxID=630683 RepID=A0A9Q0IRX1_9TELE|nr:hypothetical protein NHX12_025059 [Muraenolepis orangiensis]